MREAFYRHPPRAVKVTVPDVGLAIGLLDSARIQDGRSTKSP